MWVGARKGPFVLKSRKNASTRYICLEQLSTGLESSEILCELSLPNVVPDVATGDQQRGYVGMCRAIQHNTNNRHP
jgi:hypothetical protein